MATPIESKFVWVFFKNYIKAGHHRLATDLAHEVERVLPTMPLEGAKDLLAEAPQRPQRALWEIWANQADLSGLSLEYMARQTKELSPAILIMVWSAWMKQAVLSHYSREQIGAVARKWPQQVHKAVSAVAFDRWPHLRMPQIRVINQLGSGRR